METGKSISDVADTLRGIKATLADTVGAPLAQAIDYGGDLRTALHVARAAQDTVLQAEQLAARPASSPEAAAQRDAEVARLRQEAQGKAIMASEAAISYAGLAQICSSATDEVTGQLQETLPSTSQHTGAEAIGYSSHLSTRINASGLTAKKSADSMPDATVASSSDFNEPLNTLNLALDVAAIDCPEGISTINYSIESYIASQGVQGGFSPNEPPMTPAYPAPYAPQAPGPAPTPPTETSLADTQPQPAEPASEEVTYGELVGQLIAANGSERFKPVEYKGSRRSGPVSKVVAEVQGALRLAIKAVRADLDLQHIDPDGYKTPEAKHVVRYELTAAQERQLRDIEAELRHYMAPLSKATGLLDVETVLPESLLSKPPYISSEYSKACRLTVFRMIHQAITGKQTPEQLLASALRMTAGTDIVDNEQMLNVLHTEKFREAHKQDIHTVSFSGMTLGKIGETAAKIRRNNPQRKVYVALNVQSNNGGGNILHAVVLTSVDRSNVYYHDPATKLGGADRPMSKRAFLQRWAYASNSGYFVISEPTETGE